MSSEFLNRLNEADRELLERIGRTIRLEPRQHLLKRGEKGGDMFRVERGQLEIVDRRSRPEVILDVLGPGELVGELAFIDGTPRSADAFAGPGCVVTCWPVTDLEALIVENPSFASRFWRALAEEVAARLRAVTSSAVTGGLRGAQSSSANLDDSSASKARELAASYLQGLSRIDRRLRRNPKDRAALDEVPRLLSSQMEELERLAAQAPRNPAVRRTIRRLGQQVHPYLLQSVTAELCISRPEEHAGGPSVCRHVLEGAPQGDGPLGMALDAWLLELPRAQGLRRRHEAALNTLERFISTHLGPLRLMLVNTAPGSLLPRVHRLVSGRQGELCVVEASRQALTKLDATLPPARQGIRMRFIQERLGESAEDSSLRNLRDQDIIVLESLVEYLPARVATQCLHHMGSLLAPKGRLIVTSLAPSPDAAIWDHLLDWPIIGRRERTFAALLHAAGYGNVSVTATEGAGMVAIASRAMHR